MPTCAIAGKIDILQVVITKDTREVLSVNTGHELSK
jgi:hypothetical protein